MVAGGQMIRRGFIVYGPAAAWRTFQLTYALFSPVNPFGHLFAIPAAVALNEIKRASRPITAVYNIIMRNTQYKSFETNPFCVMNGRIYFTTPEGGKNKS